MLLFTRPLPKLKASASAFEKAGIDAVGVATSNIIDISSERKAAAEFLYYARKEDISTIFELLEQALQKLK